MKPALIAGIGNIFHADDGFGVAVARALAAMPLPAEVDAVDFGIRGLDLAYALTGGCRFAVLVDTVQRGEPPGTLYVIEPEPAPIDPGETISPHGIDPASVLRLAGLLDGEPARVLLVGCEPESFGDEEDGSMVLSAAVEAAVVPAARLALSLVEDWLREQHESASADAPSEETVQ